MIQSMFNFEESEAAAAEAIERVERNASEEWKERALGAVRLVCERLPLFTTDDVWRVLSSWSVESPHEPKAMGAIMREAKGLKMCDPTPEFRMSERVACHTRPLRVWKSLLSGAGS